jgi:UDP-N-acetylmuramoyl-tripeptide--D-alanyl-D-alanine ligase
VSVTHATLPAVTDVEPSPASPGPDGRAVGSDSSAADSAAFRADDLARLTGGQLLARSDRPIRGAAVDSRDVRPGMAFVALPGEHTDGHRFLAQAVEAGAAALLVTRPPADPGSLGDVTVVRVPDGLAALAALASAWRRRFDPLVVGVTGSIAKTSTKEAIAAVLGRRFRTLKNEGNQNNEIGLPLTVLGLGPEHGAAVFEMGMYVGGEIADLARIARPSIGVVTAVQAVHLSRIGSLEAIEAAKGELLEALPASGTAILNADDPIVRRMGARSAARPLSYGFVEDADVGAEGVSSAGLDGMSFMLRARGERRAVAIPTLGRLSVHNGLAAAAVGLAAGMSLAEIGDGLAQGWSAPHRVAAMRLGDITVIDDSYNASPGSVRAALEVLADLPGRRVAVLGEMLELGEGHETGHLAVGEAAASVVDLLIVVGTDAEGIVEGAMAAGLPAERILAAEDATAALDALRPRLRDRDVVLVKGSRGIGLDGVVAGLRADAGLEPYR